MTQREGLEGWLTARHDSHMLRAGWVKAEGQWRRLDGPFSVDDHNDWVGRANEVFAIRAALFPRTRATLSEGAGKGEGDAA